MAPQSGNTGPADRSKMDVLLFSTWRGRWPNSDLAGILPIAQIRAMTHIPALRSAIGARIVDNEIDFMIFFWDPLEQKAHDPDVKALLRMAVVWNIPTECDSSTADFMISSPLMDQPYERLVPDYDVYRRRILPQALEAAEAAQPASAGRDKK